MNSHCLSGTNSNLTVYAEVLGEGEQKRSVSWLQMVSVWTQYNTFRLSTGIWQHLPLHPATSGKMGHLHPANKMCITLTCPNYIFLPLMLFFAPHHDPLLLW